MLNVSAPALKIWSFMSSVNISLSNNCSVTKSLTDKHTPNPIPREGQLKKAEEVFLFNQI